MDQMSEELADLWEGISSKCGLSHKACSLLMAKMEKGISKHGVWNPKKDPRNHREEAREELYDAVNYLIMEYIMYRDSGSLRLLKILSTALNEFLAEVDNEIKS
jgi:hypothetical protein